MSDIECILDAGLCFKKKKLDILKAKRMMIPSLQNAQRPEMKPVSSFWNAEQLDFHTI